MSEDATGNLGPPPLPKAPKPRKYSNAPTLGAAAADESGPPKPAKPEASKPAQNGTDDSSAPQDLSVVASAKNVDGPDVTVSAADVARMYEFVRATVMAGGGFRANEAALMVERERIADLKEALADAKQREQDHKQQLASMRAQLDAALGVGGGGSALANRSITELANEDSSNRRNRSRSSGTFAPTLSQEYIDAGWKIKFKDGRPYYSNKFLRETSWELPKLDPVSIRRAAEAKKEKEDRDKAAAGNAIAVAFEKAQKYQSDARNTSAGPPPPPPPKPKKLNTYADIVSTMTNEDERIMKNVLIDAGIPEEDAATYAATLIENDVKTKEVLSFVDSDSLREMGITKVAHVTKIRAIGGVHTLHPQAGAAGAADDADDGAADEEAAARREELEQRNKELEARDREVARLKKEVLDLHSLLAAKDAEIEVLRDERTEAMARIDNLEEELWDYENLIDVPDYDQVAALEAKIQQLQTELDLRNDESGLKIRAPVIDLEEAQARARQQREHDEEILAVERRVEEKEKELVEKDQMIELLLSRIEKLSRTTNTTENRNSTSSGSLRLFRRGTRSGIPANDPPAPIQEDPPHFDQMGEPQFSEHDSIQDLEAALEAATKDREALKAMMEEENAAAAAPPPAQQQQPPQQYNDDDDAITIEEDDEFAALSDIQDLKKSKSKKTKKRWSLMPSFASSSSGGGAGSASSAKSGGGPPPPPPPPLPPSGWKAGSPSPSPAPPSAAPAPSARVANLQESSGAESQRPASVGGGGDFASELANRMANRNSALPALPSQPKPSPGGTGPPPPPRKKPEPSPPPGQGPPPPVPSVAKPKLKAPPPESDDANLAPPPIPTKPNKRASQLLDEADVMDAAAVLAGLDFGDMDGDNDGETGDAAGDDDDAAAE